MTDVNDEGPSPEVISAAREMGWKPLEEFKGNQDKWVDAETYVERGEHVLPILRADRDRLKRDLLTRDTKIDTLTKQLDVQRALIQDLGDNFTKAVEQRIADQRATLKEQLKEAEEDRDVGEALRIRDQLGELNEAEKEAKAKQAETKAKLNPTSDSTDPELSDDFKEWHADNDWFGKDKKRTKALNRIAEDLRDDGDKTTGREFMDKCLELLEESEGGATDRAPKSKVESGNARGGSRSSEERSYASLPSDAKAACEEFAEALVGPNKTYKTKAEWQKAYAKTYYGQ